MRASWPVIVRELRTEARRPMTYWLRVFGAGAVLSALVVLAFDRQGFRAGNGGILFLTVNFGLFTAIWLVVPLLTADCLSQEKRDGTLGLLFLTPLTAADVVIAKSLVHALRALTLLLAALPALMVPLLLGGVSWMDVVRITLLDVGAMILALTTGLLASSYAREWTRATMLALGLSSLAGLVFVGAHTAFRTYQLFVAVKLPFGLAQFLGFMTRWVENRVGGLLWFSGPSGLPFASTWNRGPSAADLVSVKLAAMLLAGSVVGAVLVMLVAVKRLRSAWREEPPSARQRWWLQTFCTPQFWRGLLRWRMARSLQRNPIGWLQQYSWSARLSKWGWCFGLVVVECLMVAVSSGGYWTYLRSQTILAVCLSLGMALSASSSFRRERQNGALELILVTLLPPRQVMGGRLRGLWGQFVPSLLVMLLVWWVLAAQRGRDRFAGADEGGLGLPFWLLGTFLALPIVGMQFSISARPVVLNWLLTASVGVLLPLLLVVGGRLALGASDLDAPVFGQWPWLLLCQAATGGGAWLLLQRKLEDRAFALTAGSR